MPRGIPNAKRDETGLRFTTFQVPLGLNPKHISNTYLKTESQTLWARNAKSKENKDSTAVATETRRGSNVIVIHPGSRNLRIGKACDVNPVTIPNVIARKQKFPVPKPTYIEGVTRPNTIRSNTQVSSPNSNEYAVSVTSDDPFDVKVSSTTVSLRERMRFYKLRVTQNAASIASAFNESFKPEVIPETTDPNNIDWITESNEDVIIGEKVLRLGNPHQMNYAVRWPIYGGHFNTRDYLSFQMVVSDIEAILRHTLKESLEIEPASYKDYSAILVIPDFYDRSYVRDMVNMLLVSMKFKQICVQQESLAATYGAGISNACVVDMGAVSTSIACVDDGLVLPDTRMVLNTSGNDITEFLYVLLERMGFPYRDVDLARSYDWNLMEDLKMKICTLAESDVALNLYEFIVRQPGKPTEKYGLRAYDEIILAPMCIFEPRIIEFDQKSVGLRIQKSEITEEIVEATDQFTQAMAISTQHLIPVMPPDVDPGQAPATNSLVIPDTAVDVKSEVTAPSTSTSTPAPGESSTTNPQPEDSAQQPSAMEVDKEKEDPENSPPPAAQATTKSQPPQQTQPPQPPSNALPTIDVAFEASKLPLDVAIFNSARAAGGEDKIRKYLQAVLIVGGTALIPGMAHALESRLQAIATPLVQNMEKVTIIPPPKDVDKRTLVWKGASVLGRMDSANELWVTGADWDIFGMRGLKERCFFL